MYAKGEFLAEVVSGTLAVAQTGTEQAAMQFRFLEGDNQGQTISEYLALSDAALPYSIPKLRVCGWTGDDVSDLSMCTGTKVRLVIKHEEYMGKVRARVQFINKVRELPKLEEGKRMSIAEKLKAKIAAIEAQAGATQGGGGDDNVPF